MGCLTCCHGLPIDTVPPLNGANRPPVPSTNAMAVDKKFNFFNTASVLGTNMDEERTISFLMSHSKNMKIIL